VAPSCSVDAGEASRIEAMAAHESAGPRVPITGEAPLETEAHERVAAQYHHALPAVSDKGLRPSRGQPGEARPPSGSNPASGSDEEIAADAVFLLTGYRADSRLMVDAGIELTDRQGPVYDGDTFETNVPGLFVAGGALAGIDTGTIFIENGRFHGEKIVEVI